MCACAGTLNKYCITCCNHRSQRIHRNSRILDYEMTLKRWSAGTGDFGVLETAPSMWSWNDSATRQCPTAQSSCDDRVSWSALCANAAMAGDVIRLISIENVRDTMNRQLRRLPGQPSNADLLGRRLREIWEKLPQDSQAHLVSSTWRLCTAVV